MGLSTAATIGIALTLKDEFSPKIGKAVKSADQFETKLKGLAGVAQRAGQAMSNIGDGAAKWGGRGAAVIGGSMVVGLKNAAEQAMQTEHALAGIANTAGVTNQQFKTTIGGWKTELVGLSQETNQLQGDLTRGFGALVSKGLDPSKAMGMIKPIGHAALATGADVEELGRSVYATYDNLKVPISETGKVLEVMAKAGNEGAFELKDMATYFPQMTASAQQLGMVGTKGVAQIGAALQIALKGAGDPSEAANNMKNFMSKLSSPETAKNFKKFGVNYQAEMKKAIQSGDPVQYFTELIQKTTGGDRMKLGQLFGDMQVQNFLAPMLKNMDEYKRIRDASANSEGLIKQQEVNMLQTAQEQMKRLQINTEAAVQSSDKLGGVYEKLTGLLTQFNTEGWTKTNMALAGLAAAAGVWAGGKALSLGGGLLMGKFGGKAGQAAEEALKGSSADGERVFVTNWPAAMGGRTPEMPDPLKPDSMKKPPTPGGPSTLKKVAQSALFLGASSMGEIAGMGAAAMATSAAGVAAAGAVGYGFGTILNMGINKGIEMLSGEKGATLGSKIYDWLHPETSPTLEKGSQAAQKVGGQIEVKVSMPNYLTGNATVTTPAAQGVKIAPKVGYYNMAGA